MNLSDLILVLIGLLIAYGYAAGSEERFRAVRRALLWGIGLLVVGAFLVRFRALLPPFLVPLLLAYLLDPLLDYLERRGHSRVRAILVVYGVALAVLLCLLVLIGPPLSRQVQSLVRPLTNEGGLDVAMVNELLQDEPRLRKGLAKTALDLGVPAGWVQRAEENLEQIDPQGQLQKVGIWFVEQLNSFIGWLAEQMSGLLWVVILPITLFYCLRDYDALRRRLYYLLPESRRDEVTKVAGDINLALGSYLRGYAMLSVAMGTIQTTVLLILTPIFGFKYGLFMGLLAGVTYVVPFLGSLVGTVATACVIYFTGGQSLGEALGAWVILQGINSLFDNVLAPRVIGGQVGLHPLMVMFMLLVGGAQFGLLGVVLAVPFTVCVKIILVHFFPRLAAAIPDDQTPEARALAIAQTADPPEPPGAAAAAPAQVPALPADDETTEESAQKDT